MVARNGTPRSSSRRHFAVTTDATERARSAGARCTGKASIGLDRVRGHVPPRLDRVLGHAPPPHRDLCDLPVPATAGACPSCGDGRAEVHALGARGPIERPYASPIRPARSCAKPVISAVETVLRREPRVVRPGGSVSAWSVPHIARTPVPCARHRDERFGRAPPLAEAVGPADPPHVAAPSGSPDVMGNRGRPRWRSTVAGGGYVGGCGRALPNMGVQRDRLAAQRAGEHVELVGLGRGGRVVDR